MLGQLLEAFPPSHPTGSGTILRMATSIQVCTVGRDWSSVLALRASAEQRNGCAQRLRRRLGQRRLLAPRLDWARADPLRLAWARAGVREDAARVWSHHPGEILHQSRKQSH